MRSLKRNQKTFYYRLWQGTKEILDEDENIIATNIPIYSEPIKMRANISGAAGRPFQQSLFAEPYGERLDYDKVIVTTNMDCPIEETTVLYIDKSPHKEGMIDEGYDYIVTRISKTLNAIAIAVKKVDVT